MFWYIRNNFNPLSCNYIIAGVVQSAGPGILNPYIRVQISTPEPYYKKGRIKLVQGHIYVITNKVNGKQYVGQTSRNIDTRFEEHCYDDRSNSAIHKAIKKYGINSFELKELESVDLSLLDDKEKYWIEKLDTYKNGYNCNVGGDQSLNNYKQVLIVENGMIIDSCEYLGREISSITDWSFRYIVDKIRNVIDTDKTFCNYHLKTIQAYKSQLTDIVDLENWIKKLNIQYQGQHYYCLELDKEFDTLGEMARYLKDNGYYKGHSETIQGVISALSLNLKKEEKNELFSNLSFYRAPGSTKQKGSQTPFQAKKIYCPELNLHFDSGVEAGKYLLDNKIWTGIKLKTAKLRISDVLNGIFPNYKNLTFQYD